MRERNYQIPRSNNNYPPSATTGQKRSKPSSVLRNYSTEVINNRPHNRSKETTATATTTTLSAAAASKQRRVVSFSRSTNKPSKMRTGGGGLDDSERSSGAETASFAASGSKKRRRQYHLLQQQRETSERSYRTTLRTQRSWNKTTTSVSQPSIWEKDVSIARSWTVPNPHSRRSPALELPLLPDRDGLSSERLRTVPTTDSALAYSSSAEDRFWTSPIIVVICFFVVLSVTESDVRLLIPALLAFLAKACHLISKWIVYFGKSEDLQEVIQISKGYILYFWGYIHAFLENRDSHDAGGLGIDRFRRRVTAGLVLHFHHVQLFVLTKYLQRRQNNMKAVDLKNLRAVNQHFNFMKNA